MVKCPYDFLGFVDETQDFPAGQFAFGVIISLVAQPPGVNKVFSKSLYLRRKLRERSMVTALLPGVTVFQSTVNLTPFRLPSSNVASSD